MELSWWLTAWLKFKCHRLLACLADGLVAEVGHYAAPLDEAGAQHCQSPNTATSRAVMFVMLGQALLKTGHCKI